MYSVYCVISNYNDYAWIDQCLGSLRSSRYPVKIIVVDDASTDRSCEKIKADYPEVLLIESDLNRGYSAANNIGIQRAMDEHSDYIFLLNMDARIEPYTISVLVENAEKHTEYGIISPMHLNGAGTEFDFLFETYINPMQYPELFSDMYLKKEKDLYGVHFVNSAAWLVKKEIFKEIGLLDEQFFIYGVDDNFTDRVRYNGFKIGVTPKARIFHDRGNRKEKMLKSRTGYETQLKNMKCIALNPNFGMLEKLSIGVRKSLRNMYRNIQEDNGVKIFQDLKILFYSVYFNVRYNKKYKNG